MKIASLVRFFVAKLVFNELIVSRGSGDGVCVWKLISRTRDWLIVINDESLTEKLKSFEVKIGRN